MIFMEKLLTIGMSTYDDYHGVYFSCQALNLYHERIASDDIEIIIIDNNPNSPHGKEIQNFTKGWMSHKIRYIPYEKKQSTSVRNEIFANAKGKYSISMDCHVMFAPNSIDSLLDYYAKNPDCKNLVQGPMLYDNITACSTHFNPTWGGDMYGQWGCDKESLEKNEPFSIPMHGLGVFSCETKNWLKFNESFRGFGGEEGYIHEKFRDNGGDAICLPSFKWLHRFGRPDGVPYKLVLEDRIWNYFVGLLELKKDPEHKMIKDIYDNFKSRIPEPSLNSILQQAKQAVGLS